MNLRILFRIYWIISLIVIVVSGIILLTISNQFARMVAGVVLIFVLPGYLFLRVLWPGGSTPTPIWRLTMVLPISMALVGALVLMVNYVSAYRYEQVVTLLVLMNIGLAGLAFWRSERAGSERELEGKYLLGLVERVRGYSFNVWHGILAVALLVLIGSVVYAASGTKKAAHLTEFYVMTVDAELPVSISASDNTEVALRLGIANHEGRNIEYRVMAVAKGGRGDTEVWSSSIPVSNESVAEQIVHFPSPPPDTQEVQFLLFVDGNPVPYRSLRLTVKAP